MQDIDDTVNFLQAGGPSHARARSTTLPGSPERTAPRHRRARLEVRLRVVFGAGKAFGFRGSRASPAGAVPKK